MSARVYVIADPSAPALMPVAGTYTMTDEQAARLRRQLAKFPGVELREVRQTNPDEACNTSKEQAKAALESAGLTLKQACARCESRAKEPREATPARAAVAALGAEAFDVERYAEEVRAALAPVFLELETTRRAADGVTSLVVRQGMTAPASPVVVYVATLPGGALDVAMGTTDEGKPKGWQMSSIAGPVTIAAIVSRGKTRAVGPPVEVVELVEGVATLGAAARITIPAAGAPRTMSCVYAVVPMKWVKPSHDPVTFRPTPNYPQGMQERDYAADRNEREKVMMQASRWTASIVVNTAPTAIDGPPIVQTETGYVLGGNSRAMAMARYAADEPAKYAEAVGALLAVHGRAMGLQYVAFDASMMVVRLVTIDDADAVTISRDLNRALSQAQSVIAAAVSIGRLLTPDILERIADRVSRETTREAIRAESRALVPALERARIITEAERPRWVSNGALTPRALIEVEQAMVGRIVDDVGTYAALVPRFVALLERVAPVFLALQPLQAYRQDVDDALSAIAWANQLMQQPADQLAGYVRQTDIEAPQGLPWQSRTAPARWVLWWLQAVRGPVVAAQRLRALLAFAQSAPTLLGMEQGRDDAAFVELLGMAPFEEQPTIQQDWDVYIAEGLPLRALPPVREGNPGFDSTGDLIRRGWIQTSRVNGERLDVLPFKAGNLSGSFVVYRYGDTHRLLALINEAGQAQPYQTQHEGLQHSLRYQAQNEVSRMKDAAENRIAWRVPSQWRKLSGSEVDALITEGWMMGVEGRRIAAAVAWRERKPNPDDTEPSADEWRAASGTTTGNFAVEVLPFTVDHGDGVLVLFPDGDWFSGLFIWGNGQDRRLWWINDRTSAQQVRATLERGLADLRAATDRGVNWCVPFDWTQMRSEVEAVELIEQGAGVYRNANPTPGRKAKRPTTADRSSLGEWVAGPRGWVWRLSPAVSFGVVDVGGGWALLLTYYGRTYRGPVTYAEAREAQAAAWILSAHVEAIERYGAGRYPVKAEWVEVSGDTGRTSNPMPDNRVFFDAPAGGGRSIMWNRLTSGRLSWEANSLADDFFVASETSAGWTLVFISAEGTFEIPGTWPDAQSMSNAAVAEYGRYLHDPGRRYGKVYAPGYRRLKDAETDALFTLNTGRASNPAARELNGNTTEAELMRNWRQLADGGGWLWSPPYRNDLEFLAVRDAARRWRLVLGYRGTVYALPNDEANLEDAYYRALREYGWIVQAEARNFGGWVPSYPVLHEREFTGLVESRQRNPWPWASTALNVARIITALGAAGYAAAELAKDTGDTGDAADQPPDAEPGR